MTKPSTANSARGFTLDDFTDDDLSPEDHAWLDALTQERAFDFAAEQGYDLKDYIHGGFVANWWGFTWLHLDDPGRGKGRADAGEAGRCSVVQWDAPVAHQPRAVQGTQPILSRRT
jgi:hypothetical protein